MENQKETDIAFENKHGYGGEEWLFNRRYNINGYQYGFIRGIWDVPMNIDSINETYLFSINSKTKDRLLIAILRNVELLDTDNLPKKVRKVFDDFHEDMIRELKEVNADYKSLNGFYPIVKFKIEDATIFDAPIQINQLKEGGKYNRFKPYKIDSTLQQIIKEAVKFNPFNFSPGKRKLEKDGHIRTSKPRTKNIVGVHNKISKEIENFLAPEYTIKKGNLSIEKTVFGDNIADVVLKNEDNSYSVIEIKTSNNARYNIREALGQLIDYAFWYNDVKIKEIIIVSPSSLTDEYKAYFKRIQLALKIQLKYLQYNSENEFQDRFIKNH